MNRGHWEPQKNEWVCCNERESAAAEGWNCLHEYHLSEKFHDVGETSEGHRLRLKGCAYHVCHVEPNSKTPRKHASSVPSRLVHDHWLLAGKPAQKFIRPNFIVRPGDHECLWIVAGPLFKVPAFGEASKPCKRWSKCYAEIRSTIIIDTIMT